MLDFLKKLFAAKPVQPAVTEAPYKIEAPESTANVQVDGDVVTNKPVTSVADAQAAWPFPNNQASTARKPRAPRKPQPTVEKAAETQTTPAAKKPAAKKPATSAPRKPRAPKAAS